MVFGSSTQIKKEVKQTKDKISEVIFTLNDVIYNVKHTL